MRLGVTGMKLKAKKKKILIAATAIVLVIAIGGGIWFGTRGASEPVNAYPFNLIGMTEYWGDTQESYGPVTTDKIQTVFLSETQTVTEILVKAGDTVKKGDILMSFDTTLSDLQLERKRLEVEKQKLKLTDAQTQLWEIENMEPMVVPDYIYEEEEEPSLGSALSGSYQISTRSAYDGSTPELALVCWISESRSIDNALLEAIRQQAEEFQNKNAMRESSSASALPETTAETTEAVTEETTEPTEETLIPETTEETVPAIPEETVPETTVPETTEATVPETTEATIPENTEETVPETTEETVPETTEDPTEPPHDPVEVNDYYVIIKITEGDMSLGARLSWQGLHVRGNAQTGFRFQFFDAYSIEDHTLTPSQETEESSSLPGIIFGSGYTAAQIAELRAEQKEQIKDLELDLKMAEAEYKIMQAELADGNIYSEIDGEVVSLLTEEEARQGSQPLIKVSGGGGFYMEGSVSELEKDNLQIGQEVTINDWNSGMTYTGEVKSIGDFPSSNSYWNGIGNPTTSYYPFTVFIDGSANLQAGSYVSATYSTSAAEHGIYLQKPFVRTEQGQSYVYVLGDNGKLEKRFVTLGKSLWGSYQEILSGLTEEDLIAFPYGKTVKEDAPAVEGDLSTLYDY